MDIALRSPAITKKLNKGLLKKEQSGEKVVAIYVSLEDYAHTLKELGIDEKIDLAFKGIPIKGWIYCNTGYPVFATEMKFQGINDTWLNKSNG